MTAAVCLRHFCLCPLKCLIPRGGNPAPFHRAPSGDPAAAPSRRRRQASVVKSLFRCIFALCRRKKNSSSLLFPLLRNSKPRRNTTAKRKRRCHVFTIWEHKGRYIRLLFSSLFVAATFFVLFLCVRDRCLFFQKNFSSLPENCLVFFSPSCLFLRESLCVLR